VLALGLSDALPAAEGADWPHWRGPEDNGCASQGTYPVKWDAASVLWKADLPGKGCSTPIVWAKRIFLTAPTNGQDAALAFDWDGRLLWQTVFGAAERGKRANSSGCNPSAVTDGASVFVRFKSGTLAALDFEGKVRWQTNLVTAFGPDSLFWDLGTSPVLVENAVVIARMHHGDSWLAAFDKASGKILWKVPRNYETAVEGDNSYTSPVVIRQQGQEVILTWGGEHLTAHAAADGRLLWSCGDFNPQGTGFWPTVASPVVVGDIALVYAGRADKGQPRLHAIKLGGSGDVTATHRLWKRQDTGTFVPTPAVYQGRVYLLRDGGDIECLDPVKGETLWKGSVARGGRAFYSSPVIAGGKLYVARDDGAVFVGKLGDKFELLAENDMGEQIIASPVPVGNRLLLRTDRHLFCVAGE
jgi:outer membrane protein assembly factor BamB